jgi:hypothetical protein
MNDLNIESTKYTPQIVTNLQNGTIDIIGKSYPENTFEFYRPLMDWIEEYFKSPNSKTTVNMEIIYFNSSSSKLLFDLFDLLEEHGDLSDIIINWIYDSENESAIEAGEDFIEDFEDLNIVLVEK